MNSASAATRKRPIALLLLVLLILATLMVGAQPAHADRCQPEELIPGFGASPVPENASPICLVADEVLYPLIGCDTDATNTLQMCAASLGADTAFTVVDRAPNLPGYLSSAATKAPGVTRNLVVFTTGTGADAFATACLVVVNNPFAPILASCESPA